MCTNLRTSLVFIFPLLILVGFHITPATASELACGGRFENKTVRIIVPSKAGGGYDVYSRIFAPHNAKFIGANVLIEN